MTSQKNSHQTLSSLLMISIFSIVKNTNLSKDQVNSDLEKISNWAHSVESDA